MRAVVASIHRAVHWILNGDDTSKLTTQVTLATAAPAPSEVGTGTITASDADSPNYSFTYVAGSLMITQSVTTGAVVSSANPAVPGASPFTTQAPVRLGVHLGQEPRSERHASLAKPQGRRI